MTKAIEFATFDTEGTRYTDPDTGEKFAVLYNWDLLTLRGNTSFADKVTKDNVGDLTYRHEGRDVYTLYAYLTTLVNRRGNKEIRIAVHNLSYDYAYLRAWVDAMREAGKAVQVVARSSTQILKVSVGYIAHKHFVPLVTFFDTLAIFAKSLRNLGESLGYEKEHLDYLEDIAPDTEYAEGNTTYNHRDTDLLMVAVCSSLIKQPGVTIKALGDTILTKTGIVRVLDKTDEHIGGMVVGQRMTSQGKKKVTLYDLDRQFVADHQMTDLDLLRTWGSYGSTQNGTPGCYAGGVNLCSTKYIGKVTPGVISYDLKSAYPGIILSMSVPINPVKITDPTGYESLLEPRTPSIEEVLRGVEPFWVGTIKLTNLNMKPDWAEHVSDSSITEAMVTQHRHEQVGVRFADGHLDHADEMTLTLCNPSWYELCTEYTFDTATFSSLTVYTDYALPTAWMVVRTIHHYREKTTAKTLGKAYMNGTLTDEDADAALAAGYISADECERLKSTKGDPDERWAKAFIQGHKGNLNSLYGVLVTAVLRDSYDLDADGWLEREDDVPEEQWREYSEGGDARLMWREAGVMVALLNRYKIVHMIDLAIHAGADVLYTDTDSIKTVGLTREQLDAAFAEAHEGIERRTRYVTSTVLGELNERIAASNEAHGYDTPLVPIPDDPDFLALGKLDYEGQYEKFVPMGHKKYAVAHPTKTWDFACSGYKLSVLDEVCAAMLAAGVPTDDVPLYILGYDVRYDAPTGIASLQVGVRDLWRHVRMDAQDRAGDREHRHVYEGDTCPGYAIYDAGKIMNHTDSLMNGARYRAAARNNPRVAWASRTDISRDDEGNIIWGHRGTVPMTWKDWDIPDSAWEEDTTL